MKKMIKVSFIYVILALVCCFLYRKFTKLNGFTGTTVLANIHVHLMVLGTFMFMILALFSQRTNLISEKKFKYFMIVYNGGLLITVIMLMMRGVLQVLGTSVSSGMNAAISGIAGIGHILLGVGLIILMVILLKLSEKENEHESNSVI